MNQRADAQKLLSDLANAIRNEPGEKIAGVPVNPYAGAPLHGAVLQYINGQAVWAQLPPPPVLPDEKRWQWLAGSRMVIGKQWTNAHGDTLPVGTLVEVLRVNGETADTKAVETGELWNVQVFDLRFAPEGT